MYSHEDALKCIEGYNGKKLLGSLVTVELVSKILRYFELEASSNEPILIPRIPSIE